MPPSDSPPALDLNADCVVLGDNLPIMQALPPASARLIYLDPPFNTGKEQRRTQIATPIDENGDRTGFQGKRYRTTVLGTRGYGDRFEDYLAFLEPRLREARRILTADGSLYFHIDYRESAYCKVLLDEIFGRDCFLNEIIWAYDYGARSTRRWPAKHDTILWYARNAHRYVFNYEGLDRIPYMAPGLVGPEKAARGKTPTDVWWHTIVSPTGSEKTGYPTQKPLGVLRRIIAASSRPGDMVMDFFAGSGTTGAAARELGRRFLLVDDNPQAMEVMAERFKGQDVVFLGWAEEPGAGA